MPPTRLRSRVIAMLSTHALIRWCAAQSACRTDPEPLNLKEHCPEERIAGSDSAVASSPVDSLSYLIDMSLKAKIEAVIYAAEEPVTLAQLSGLLGGEAAAELDRLHERQSLLPLDVDGAEDSLPGRPDLRGDEVLASDQPEDLEAEKPAQTEYAAGAAPEPQEKRLAREGKLRERAVREYIRGLLDELMRDYASPDRGLEIREVASGFRLATKPECHDAVRGFARGLKPPLKLTLQALETLAVVAYKQPVTAPEITEIRGVDSGGVLGSLMARKLVTTAGRKQVIGRPILYKTTKDFLLRFGLKDVNELPSIEEFEKMAGEFAENDAVQEEIEMPDERQAAHESITGAPLEAEKSATMPQADGDSSSPTGAPEAAPVDGRLSGTHAPEADSVDSSAGDAMIQQDEAAERERSQS